MKNVNEVTQAVVEVVEAVRPVEARLESELAIHLERPRAIYHARLSHNPSGFSTYSLYPLRANRNKRKRLKQDHVSLFNPTVSYSYSLEDSQAG